MILNLLRVEDFKVQDMIRRSFSEFGAQKLLPQQQSLLRRATEKLNTVKDIECILVRGKEREREREREREKEREERKKEIE
jgi:superfamily II RNA helicase